MRHHSLIASGTRIIAGMAAILCFFPGVLPAQQQGVLYEIERAYSAGELSLDDKILYQFRAVMEPGRLPAVFGQTAGGIIKCGTPPAAALHVHREELSASTLAELEPYTAPQAGSAQQTYLSPSGKFMLHYETTGEDSVRSEDNDGNGIPDYVEQTAEAADSSWNHMVGRLGYTDPILGPGSPYDLYFVNFSFIYGRTVADGGTTFIELHSTFENFPPNDDPEGDVIGAMKVTVAHELKHAIQYAANGWQGSAGSFGWIEMDGTLMEEVVYDNVNDYYNYISDPASIFLSPGSSLPGAYWDVTWALFFEEELGSMFWVRVWEDIEANPAKNYLAAIKDELDENDRLYYRSFAESFLWHYASGTNFSAARYGFGERFNYPDPSITLTVNGGGGTVTPPGRLAPLSGHFIRILPAGTEAGQVLISLDTDSTGLAAGALAYFEDGSVQSWFGTSSLDGNLVLETTWDWSAIREIGLVTVNTTQAQLVEYNGQVASHQAELITLQQNYPNPFNPETTIRFTLREPANISLKIYDVAGRLVQTLADGNFTSGPHEIQFNAERLASGVYFYRLSTGRKTVNKKMLLIK